LRFGENYLKPKKKYIKSTSKFKIKGLSGALIIMRVLRFTLHRKWFNEIAAGIKKKEYRSIKPYWESRLLDNGEFRIYDEVWFTNGYGATRPFMRVEFLGTEYDNYEGELHFAINFDEIFEIKNYAVSIK